MEKLEYLYSNQLMQALLLSIVKAKQSNKDSIDIYLILECLVEQKNSLASKIFNEIYPDSTKILKNFKNLINQKQKKITSNKFKKEISFTPLVKHLLFTASTRGKKVSKVITTKDILLLIIKHKRIKYYLELARKKAKN